MEPTDIPQPEITPGTKWKTVGGGGTGAKKSPKKPKHHAKKSFKEMRDALDPELKAQWER
jgi:hypothetical protein